MKSYVAAICAGFLALSGIGMEANCSTSSAEKEKPEAETPNEARTLFRIYGQSVRDAAQRAQDVLASVSENPQKGEEESKVIVKTMLELRDVITSTFDPLVIFFSQKPRSKAIQGNLGSSFIKSHDFCTDIYRKFVKNESMYSSLGKSGVDEKFYEAESISKEVKEFGENLCSTADRIQDNGTITEPVSNNS